MSLLDDYDVSLPADIPGVSIDPRELERAKALAMMRAGLGMASREPIGSALSAGAKTYFGAEQQARQMMLAQLQAYKNRQEIETKARQLIKEKAFIARMTPEQRAQIGIGDDVWNAIMATEKPAEQYLTRDESKPKKMTPEGMVLLRDERGNEIGMVPGVNSIEAQTARTTAIEGAKAGAQAKYQFIDVPAGKNQTIKVRADHLALLNSTGLPEADKLQIIQSVPSDQMLGAIKARMAARGLIAQPKVGGVYGDGTPTGNVSAQAPAAPAPVAGGVPPQGGFGVSADPNFMEREKGQESTYRAQIAKDFPTAARLARVSIPLNNQALDILNSGQVITGKGASFLTEFGGWLAQTGHGDPENFVSNTQTFAINQAQETLAILSSGALGSGTGISSKDQEFAQKLAGGQIDLTLDALKRITRINMQVHREFIAQHNDQVDRYAKTFGDDKIRGLYSVEPPAAYAPPKPVTVKPPGGAVAPTGATAQPQVQRALTLRELEQREREIRARLGNGAP